LRQRWRREPSVRIGSIVKVCPTAIVPGRLLLFDLVWG
jgi:hypothetical protein